MFTSVVDPVGAGFVASLARPGGNTTGFMQLEYSIGTKWLELLKDAEPRVTRVAVLRDPTLASGKRPVRRDPGRGVIVRRGAEPDRVRDTSEIERASQGIRAPARTAD